MVSPLRRGRAVPLGGVSAHVPEGLLSPRVTLPGGQASRRCRRVAQPRDAWLSCSIPCPALLSSKPPVDRKCLWAQEKAAAVGAPLGLAPALAEYEAGGAPPVRVGLAGEHQRGNAALAVALAAAWEARAGAGAAPGQAAAPATAVATPSGLGAGENPAGPAARDGAAAGPPADAGAAGRGGGRQGAEAGGPGGAAARAAAVAARRLPDAYLRGLAACRWPGRAQARPAHMYPITLPYPTLQSAHVCKGGWMGVGRAQALRWSTLVARVLCCVLPARRRIGARCIAACPGRWLCAQPQHSEGGLICCDIGRPSCWAAEPQARARPRACACTRAESHGAGPRRWSMTWRAARTRRRR